MSFEIAFENENTDDSIIKKHPPKRFQKLEEQQTSPSVSLEKLQEKLDEAEIRRQQVKDVLFCFVFFLYYCVKVHCN